MLPNSTGVVVGFDESALTWRSLNEDPLSSMELATMPLGAVVL